MLLTLLIVTQVTAEWVKISQQHYRKPIHALSTNSRFTTQDTIQVEETTKAWHYNNRSVTEYNWNEASIRQSNVKRVQYSGSDAKHTKIVMDDEEYPDLNSDEFELRPNHEQNIPSIKFNNNIKQKSTIERVPHIGNVQRVQLNNSPVKSPVVNIDTDKEDIPKTRYEEFPIDNGQKGVELLESPKNTTTKLNNRRIYVNKIKNKYTTEAASTLPIEDESSFTEEVRVVKNTEFKNRSNVKNVFLPKPTFVTETEDFIQYGKDENRFHKTSPSSSHIQPTETTEIAEDVTKRTDEMSKDQTTKSYDSKNTEGEASDIVKRRPVNKLTQKELNKNYEDVTITNNEQKKPIKKNNFKIELDPKPENEKNNNKIIDQEKGKTDKITKDNKSEKEQKNMANLLKIIKVVADTISQNTRRSFGGKMRYLHDLKDSILGNIAERIDATWPDDDVTGPHRRSRSAHFSPRGHHVAFPSSESSLMTISFLTFAVFLIKLVLQIIQTYKNKAMMVTPVMVAAAGRAASTLRGKR